VLHVDLLVSIIIVVVIRWFNVKGDQLSIATKIIFLH